MKYIVSYSNLLLNTMLDTIKRENRRTIDGTDIINFERVVKSIIKENGLPMEFDSINNGRKFLDEINPFIFTVEKDGKETYTLLPWISEQDLEESISNTIFVDMGYVYDITKDELFFKRNSRSIYRLRDIEKEVNNNFLRSTQNNLVKLEKERQKELVKFERIKQNLGMSD